MANKIGNFVQDLRLPKGFSREPRFIKIVRKYGGDGVLAVLLLWEWMAENNPLTGRFEKMEREDVLHICSARTEHTAFIDDLIKNELLGLGEDGVYFLPNWREEQPHVAQAEERSEAARAKAMKRWGTRAEFKNESGGDAKKKPKQCRGNAAALPEQCSNTNTKSKKPPLPPTGGEGEGELVRGVVELCAELLPELPKPEITERVSRDIEARAKASPERQGLEWWRGYFGLVRQYPHLMGSASSGWRASLSWLVGGANMDKVLGGEYRQGAPDAGQPQGPAIDFDEWAKQNSGPEPDSPQ